MDGSIVFTRWRQCALPCGHMRAHWRYLANMTELVLPSDYQNPQPKRQIDRFSLFAHCSRQCRRVQWRHMANTIEQWHNLANTKLNLCFFRPTRVHNPNAKSIGSVVSPELTAESLYILQLATLSTKLPLLMRGSGPHVIHDSLGQSETTIKRHVDRFSRFSADDRRVPILYSPPSKLSLPMGDLDSI